MDLLAGAMMTMMAAQAPAAMPAMADAAVACPATPAALPADLAGWTRMTPVRAGSAAATAPALTLDAGARATLLPTAAVAYALAPQKPGDAASSGGIFAFTSPATGTYRVAIGTAAWIDVVHDGKAIASSAHTHGPACSGIRKMVDFTLSPGRYLLQIAGNEGATLPLMVTRLR